MKDSPGVTTGIQALMDVREVAKFLRIPPSTIYWLVNHRRIPYLRIRSRVRFELPALVEWLKRKRVTPIDTISFSIDDSGLRPPCA